MHPQINSTSLTPPPWPGSEWMEAAGCTHWKARKKFFEHCGFQWPWAKPSLPQPPYGSVVKCSIWKLITGHHPANIRQWDAIALHGVK